MKIEMFVRLVVPDNTASTARRTAIAMGFPIKDIKRDEYYSFDVSDDVSEKLSKTDVLVNANKHKCVIRKDDESLSGEEGVFKILVKDKEDGTAGLLSTLKERLGFTQINSMSKGTLWTLYVKEGGKEVAQKLAEELLSNKHYQEYSFYE